MYNELIQRQSIYNDDKVSAQFFSSQNTDVIQNMIQAHIQQKLQHKISRQSDTELFIIMQSIHKQHARNMPTHIQEQVNELNDITVKEASRLITPKLLQYIGYMKDLEKGIEVMDRARNTSSAGSNINYYDL